MEGIKNIIFDLGGVVMNIDFKKTEAAFAALGFSSFAQYMTQYHITPFFEDYETGKIGNDAFIRGVQELAPGPISNADIVAAWNALLLDFPPERIAWLEKIKKQYRIFLLSNTNALHYDAFLKILQAATGKKLDELFERTYFSHTVKLRKPDTAVYQLVLDENGLQAAQTLFIDDTASNFSGAEALGIHTFHLQKPMTLFDIPGLND